MAKEKIKNKAPSLQWYPEKWWMDTRRLSRNVKSIYHDLLMVIWMQFPETCAIPDDNKFIAAEVGCTNEEWIEAKIEIMWSFRPLLDQTNGFLFSKGLWKERVKQIAHRAKQKENGEKGGRPKGPKDKDNKPTGYSKETQTKAKKSLPSPIPSPSPVGGNTESSNSLNLGSPAKAGRTKGKRVPFPEGFALTWSMIEYGKKQGVGTYGRTMDEEFEAFRNHHTAKGSMMVDWPAAWRTWCGNAKQIGNRSGGGNGKQKSNFERSKDNIRQFHEETSGGNVDSGIFGSRCDIPPDGVAEGDGPSDAGIPRRPDA